ncbi:CRISPR-associated endonuclease Cas1 [Desulfatibacillum aliphaticivorans]|uniref:CRISPR-associated endonuclease Cas1 n=1 Tax=Desulfatibacillum aliphaticivorans TaxID=218208 RepID=UPI0004030063|nr:CRISPR-associated endonuclease Cas1 [Desulfatibacillum aliphaticivorans]
METLFISREANLSRRENTLIVSMDGQKRFFPIEKIRHIVMLGQGRFNSAFLCLCGAHGVRVSVFDYYGYYKGSFEPKPQNPSGRVVKEQARCILDDQIRLETAREIVRGAWRNMRANLAYYQYRGQKRLDPILEQMDNMAEKIETAPSIPKLMGAEGVLHARYFAAWPIVDPRLDFAPRIRRPPNNPINCLISFFNQLTYTAVRHEVYKTHLEETLSWLHSPGTGRSSLSLDLAEPFKPILADNLIFRLIRKNILADNWFSQKDKVCLLTETGRRHAAEHFSTRLEERYKGKSYREWIYREAVALERSVMGLTPYEAFKRKP